MEANTRAEYNKKYYQENKTKWDRPKKIFCEICKKEIKKDHYKSHHIKTKTHIRLLQEKENHESSYEALRDKLKQEILNELKK